MTDTTKPRKPQAQRPSGFWTKERCIEMAKGYTTLKAFRIDHPGGMQCIWHRGWTNEVFAHIPRTRSPRMPNGYWTREVLLAVAKPFNTVLEFHTKCSAAYLAACRLGLLDEVCGHMARRPGRPRRQAAAIIADGAP